MFRHRYRRIVGFFARVIAGLIIWELILPRLGLRRWVRRSRSRRLHTIAVDYRALAIEMGGVLIKVGQFLSSRVDVLPEEITAELSGLQDEVPPEDFAAIRQLAEAELGAPLTEKFALFESTPLAAASLGQVHRARLHPENRLAAGFEEVVVKIQRPNIEAILATDLAALRTVAGWIRHYPPIRRRADVPALLDEFARVLYEEIDYLAEGRNAETFAGNFKDYPDIRIPAVIWPLTTRKVLTLEDVLAIKITDYQAITAAGLDRAEVSARLFDVYLKQIFEDSFFHADPHPGNLFVCPRPAHAGETAAEPGETPAWQLTFVDFGMVGRVPANLRAGLREVVIAVGTQDSGRLVQAYQKLGVLLPHANLELLEQAEAKVFEQFWGKSMSELREISFDEMRAFAKEFRQLVYTMPFQVPQDLIFLLRTVAILSGMCTGLNPDFNPWESLAPYAQRLLAEETVSNWEFWLEEAGELVRALLGLPQPLSRVMRKLDQGQLEIRMPEVNQQLKRLELTARRLVGALIFAALLAGGVQLLLAGETIFGGSLLGGALVALAWVIFARQEP